MESSFQARLKVHSKLVEVMQGKKVYFQPPENLRLERPCLIYKVSNIFDLFADNVTYQRRRRYEIILVDDNPDSEYFDRLMEAFTYIKFNRFYIADSNNHWSFELYHV